jgi:hypothetical protein
MADFNVWLHSYISEKTNQLCAPQYPPCDDPTVNYYEVEIQSAVCIFYKHDLIYGETEIYKNYIVSCTGENAYCKSIWRVCIDYNPPIHIDKQLISKEVINVPHCNWDRPDLPPAGYGWDEPWETDCFRTQCN